MALTGPAGSGRRGSRGSRRRPRRRRGPRRCPPLRPRRRATSGSTWPRNTRSLIRSGMSITLRSPHRLPFSKSCSVSAPPAETRIDATAPETRTVASRATPPTTRRVVVAEMASASDAQYRENSATATGTCHRTSAFSVTKSSAPSCDHEHLADEQHDLGQEAEAEEDGGEGPDLGEHVVVARERTGEDQRQDAVAPVGTHHVRRRDRHEEQQRGGHAHVVAEGDQVEVGGRGVPGDVLHADVHHGRDRGDREQRPRQDLLAPRPAQAEGTADRDAHEGGTGGAPTPELALVGAVATVVDGAGGRQQRRAHGVRPGTARRGRCAGWSGRAGRGRGRRRRRG